MTISAGRRFGADLTNNTAVHPGAPKNPAQKKRDATPPPPQQQETQPLPKPNTKSAIEAADARSDSEGRLLRQGGEKAVPKASSPADACFASPESGSLPQKNVTVARRRRRLSLRRVVHLALLFVLIGASCGVTWIICEGEDLFCAGSSLKLALANLASSLESNNIFDVRLLLPASKLLTRNVQQQWADMPEALWEQYRATAGEGGEGGEVHRQLLLAGYAWNARNRASGVPSLAALESDSKQLLSVSSESSSSLALKASESIRSLLLAVSEPFISYYCAAQSVLVPTLDRLASNFFSASATSEAERVSPAGEAVGAIEATEQVRHCESWAENGECEKNPRYMRRKCREACKKHRSKSMAPPAKEKQNQAEQDHPEPCVDQGQHCGDWAAGGECENNPQYMSTQCSKACKVC